MRQVLGSISMLNGCRHYCTDTHGNSQFCSRSLRVYAGGITQQELPAEQTACKTASLWVKLSNSAVFLQGFTEFTDQNGHVMIVYLLQQLGKHESHFKDLTSDDSGMYQCIAENRHGVIQANAELRVFGKLLHDWKGDDPTLFSKSAAHNDFKPDNPQI